VTDLPVRSHQDLSRKLSIVRGLLSVYLTEDAGMQTHSGSAWCEPQNPSSSGGSRPKSGCVGRY